MMNTTVTGLHPTTRITLPGLDPFYMDNPAKVTGNIKPCGCHGDYILCKEHYAGE